MFKKLAAILCLTAALWAVDYEKNDWLYPGFWNLYNSGLTKPNPPALQKSSADRARWNATLRLNNYHFVNAYIGGRFYFLTEYSGDDAVRLAPSFYVLKNKREYQVWWNAPGTDSRRYFSFWGRDGVIAGSMDIPALEDAEYYASTEGGGPFKITDASPLTAADVRQGLRTDWQHDIPGEYVISPVEKYPGLSGRAVFTHFYLGKLPPVMALSPTQNERLSGLTAREKEILANECGLPVEVFRGNILPQNYYYCPEARLDNALAYFAAHSKTFRADSYFRKKNYLPYGANGLQDRVVITKEPGLEISGAGGLALRGKKDPFSWTIISLGAVTEPKALAELKGVVRLSVWCRAKGLRDGYYGWQKPFIDVVQYDRGGRIIGANDDLNFTVLSRVPRIENYSGVLEHEFIVAKDAVKIELLLKIPGSPDADKSKPGAVFDSFVLEKVALQKASGVLNTAALFNAPKPLEIKNGEALFAPAGAGLFVGGRSFTLDNARKKIQFDLQDAGDYSGFYTNIFSVAGLDELEISAVMDSALKAYGAPPDWASNALEIVYFDYNGLQVYPADSGAERYPKISAAPNARAARKGLFIVPKERGAYYAQVRLHFSRKDDPERNRPDTKNYFLGQASAESIVLRPALQPVSTANVLPGDGTFYDNINGKPLSWTAQGAWVEENLPSASRKIVFNNPNSGWSSIKTVITVPEEATALRGRMNIDLQAAETGLNDWEGFGFFLEADVETPGGALFHYGGIPVFEVSGNKFVRLERLSLPQRREIEYYIPLNHEYQKIVKLYWQIAFLGKGRAELLPLAAQPEASLLTVEFWREPAFNPLLWSQLALYSADGNSFQFQKSYELKTGSGVYSYQYAELLAERLRSAGLEKQDITAELKKLNLDEVRKTPQYEVKAKSTYGRVSTYAEFDGQVIEVAFKTSGTPDARFNLQAYIVDEKTGNVHQAPIYRLDPDGRWKTIDRIFEVSGAERFVIDSSEYPDGLAKKALLILGGYNGIVTYSDLTLTNYAKFDKKTLSGQRGSQKISALGQGQLLARPAQLDRLNNANLVDLDNAYPLAFFSEQTKARDTQIRSSVKNNKWSFNRGTWLAQDGREFALTGVTLLGETFKNWQELRAREYAEDTEPYWYADLLQKPAGRPDTLEKYLLLFCEAQGKVWKRAGLNTIRLHQLFSSWSDLSAADLDVLIQALRRWQDEGFVIIVDALPNTDFTGSYFGQEFAGKPYAAVFSEMNDLFKAALVLPEVSEQYVKPALGKLLNSFKQNNFWPDSLTYSNETGFTRGFWTIDKYNSQSNAYFSRAYHYYYARYLELTKDDSYWQNFMEQADALLRAHIQHIRVKELLTDMRAINNMLTERYYVKDTGGYVCYNILRDDALAAYPLYQDDLRALREDGYRWITDAEATGNFVEQAVKLAQENQVRLNKLALQVEAAETKTARGIQSLLTAPALRNKLKELHAAVFSSPMPENYRIPDNIHLRWSDDFLNYDKPQVFFTSFLLPVVFTQEINAYLRAQEPKSRLVIGMNNDYARDTGALLGQAYVFFNEPNIELRFNKYAHHPIDGHSMLLNPGFGNVFEEDSSIPFNLALFTPPSGFPAQLSETNYTFSGNDDAGEGVWTIMDYLKLTAQKKQILFFHSGPNAADKPLINDYFNMGNRPYQLNAMGLIASVALQKNLDPQYIKADDFNYDRYSEKIDLKAKGINGISGRVKPQGELKGRALRFVYQGERPRTNITILEQKISAGETAVYFFGLERNKRQENRPGNPELLQSFGLNTIQYEHIPGRLFLSKRPVSRVTGYYPSGRTVDIPLKNVKQEANATALDLTAFPGVVCYYLRQ
ncbi:MAG: hypothetical protein LBD99_07470 [Candidatus Margulisbacteria bacterium]|jgi:hypothetical protein|nr:hypothetical protein [Candidatus Margulisiibacteriota bacterium]